MTLSSPTHTKTGPVCANLRPTHVLQLEELLHEDLVDLDKNHAHAIAVHQRQVSVTLCGQDVRSVLLTHTR